MKRKVIPTIVFIFIVAITVQAEASAQSLLIRCQNFLMGKEASHKKQFSLAVAELQSELMTNPIAPGERLTDSRASRLSYMLEKIVDTRVALKDQEFDVETGRILLGLYKGLFLHPDFIYPMLADSYQRALLSLENKETVGLIIETVMRWRRIFERDVVPRLTEILEQEYVTTGIDPQLKSMFLDVKIQHDENRQALIRLEARISVLREVLNWKTIGFDDLLAESVHLSRFNVNQYGIGGGLPKNGTLVRAGYSFFDVRQVDRAIVYHRAKIDFDFDAQKRIRIIEAEILNGTDNTATSSSFGLEGLVIAVSSDIIYLLIEGDQPVVIEVPIHNIIRLFIKPIHG